MPSSVLRRLNATNLIEDRKMILLDKFRAIKNASDVQCSKIKTEFEDFNEYAFLYFMKDYIGELDRSSQVIMLHSIRGFEIKATKTITSLSENEINKILCYMIRTAFKKIKQFKYEEALRDYWYTKALVCDLIKTEKNDTEVMRIHNEEIQVVKILRYVSNLVL